MGRTLVLNATYQPLCAVAARRAVVLLLKGKAEILEVDGGAFHSEKLTIPIPAVVKLKYYVRVPHRVRVTLSRKAVFMRDGHTCQYCGAQAENVDHVEPLSRGGAHAWSNVVASCRRCNSRKENRLPHEVGLRLRRQPKPPKDSMFLMLSVGTLHPSWGPYLEPGHRVTFEVAAAPSS